MESRAYYRLNSYLASQFVASLLDLGLFIVEVCEATQMIVEPDFLGNLDYFLCVVHLAVEIPFADDIPLFLE